MRGILIDPAIRCISEADVGEGLEGIYKILSVGDHVVTCVANASAHLSESVYVDEEALWKPGLRGWSWKGYEDYPFFGRGVLLGLNAEGETVSTERLLVELQDQVVWNSYMTTGKTNETHNA